MAREGISKRTRFLVLQRDEFTCQYCGAKAPDVEVEVDHVHPIAQGGRTRLLNLVTACFDCNRGKTWKSLESIPRTGAWIEPEDPLDFPPLRFTPGLHIPGEFSGPLTDYHLGICEQVATDNFRSFRRISRKLDLDLISAEPDGETPELLDAEEGIWRGDFSGNNWGPMGEPA